jgi:hypothetical protein
MTWTDTQTTSVKGKALLYNKTTKFINPRHTCAARVTILLCVYVNACLSVTTFFRLRATRQQNSDTNGFIATLASFKKRRFLYNYCVAKIWHEKQVDKPISKSAQAYVPLPGPLALCTLEAQEVTTNGVHRLLHAILLL